MAIEILTQIFVAFTAFALCMVWPLLFAWAIISGDVPDNPTK